MPSRPRARKGEFVSRVPQSALDEISIQMQEMREQREHDKATIAEFVKLARLVVGMNIFGSVENAAIRDKARDLLVDVGAIKS